MNTHHLQNLIYDFGVRAFGFENMSNPQMRALRLAEEVVEAAQVFGLPKDKLHHLIDIVYSRPVGEETKELSQIGMTWVAMCHSRGQDIEELLMMELRRCLSKDPAEFKKRNQEKVDLGLRVD